jgi:hypothetical protein
MSFEIEKTVVGLFQNVKVYQVDANDSHLKKFDLISNNASMEIYILDHLNQVNLRLLSNEVNSFLETIYLNAKLNDFNLIMNSSKKIELKRNDFINKSKYFAVEFYDVDDNERFKNCLDYLKEIYQINDHSDIEMVSSDVAVSKKNEKLKNRNEDLIEICFKLKESILIGDICLASMYAIKLAELKPDLNITIKDESETITNAILDDVITDKNTNFDNPVLKKIEINIRSDNDFDKMNECSQKLETQLNTLTTKVSDLKKLVSFHFDIPIDQQLIIINECSTNDNDLIEDYAKSLFTKPNTASNLCSEPDNFIVYVLTISHVEETCLETVDEWICEECKYENIAERCTNCFVIKPSNHKYLNNEISLLNKQVC